MTASRASTVLSDTSARRWSVFAESIPPASCARSAWSIDTHAAWSGLLGDGTPCQGIAIRGGERCRMHGGATLRAREAGEADVQLARATARYEEAPALSTDGRRHLRAIEELAAPTIWAAIPPTREAGEPWVAEVAERLGDGTPVRAALLEELRHVHHGFSQPEHQWVAVWVPDRAEPHIAGVMSLDWLVPDNATPASREDYRALVEPDRRGLVVLDRHLEDVELPAGPALCVREATATGAAGAAGRSVQCDVVYTVFPHAGTDAIELTFVTD